MSERRFDSARANDEAGFDYRRVARDHGVDEATADALWAQLQRDSRHQNQGWLVAEFLGKLRRATGVRTGARGWPGKRTRVEAELARHRHRAHAAAAPHESDDSHELSFELRDTPAMSVATAKDWRPAELRVLKWLRAHQNEIVAEESARRIDRRAIAGAIAWEALENNPRFGSYRAVGPGKVHYRDWPLKGESELISAQVEQAGYLPQRSEAERAEVLRTPEGAIQYIGAIMAAIADVAREVGRDIRRNPVMLTQVYQSKNLESWRQLLRSKSPTQPLVAKERMAVWTAEHLEFLEDCVGKTALPRPVDASLGPPTAAPPTAAAPNPVAIAFGANANAAVVWPQMIEIIKDGFQAAGKPAATITSTARTPTDQARSMFNNLVNPAHPVAVNVTNQLALYLAPGKAVINVFVAMTQGMTLPIITSHQTAIKAAMVQEILTQGPSHVSKHCVDSAVACVVDVSAAALGTAGDLFVASVKPRVSKLIDERNTNGCYHLELH